MSREVTIDRDADGPFASLASESWFRVTDDHVPEPELGDWPEFYFRAGMLNGFQLLGQAASEPDSERSQRVLAALTVALEMLDSDPDS